MRYNLANLLAFSANTYRFIVSDNGAVAKCNSPLDIDPFEIFDIRLRRSICADALDMHILCKRDLYHIEFVKRTYRILRSNIYRFCEAKISTSLARVCCSSFRNTPTSSASFGGTFPKGEGIGASTHAANFQFTER